MCFLSYVKTKNGVCITHNRDEDRTRAENTEFVIKKINQTEVTMPIDGKSGGTWIATGGNYTLAIINGGKENHIKKTTYLKSRGTIIPLFFCYDNFEKFVSKLGDEEFESFTLVYYDSKNHDLRTIVRSENEQIILILDPNVVHTWSSATLYPENIRTARNDHFRKTLKIHSKARDIFEIHSKKGGSLETCFNVEVTPEIMTVAITQISFDEGEKQYRDLDFVNGVKKEIGIRN